MKYRLKVEEVRSFPSESYLCVRVLRGELWVTVEGLSEDIVVTKACGFETHAKGLVVVQALKATTFEVVQKKQGQWTSQPADAMPKVSVSL